MFHNDLAGTTIGISLAFLPVVDEMQCDNSAFDNFRSRTGRLLPGQFNIALRTEDVAWLRARRLQAVRRPAIPIVGRRYSFEELEYRPHRQATRSDGRETPGTGLTVSCVATVCAAPPSGTGPFMVGATL